MQHAKQSIFLDTIAMAFAFFPVPVYDQSNSDRSNFPGMAAIIQSIEGESNRKNPETVRRKEISMIKHIVLWKLKEVSECGDRLQNARKMKQDLEALKAVIPQIRHIEVGLNSIPSDASYDVALYSEFESEKDLDIYQKHPEHLKVAEFVGKVRERRVVVDYHVG